MNNYKRAQNKVVNGQLIQIKLNGKQSLINSLFNSENEAKCLFYIVIVSILDLK